MNSRQLLDFISKVDKDLAIIAEIESGGDPEAVGSAGEYGAFQLTKAVVKDYEKATGTKVNLYAFSDQLKVALWYWRVRIPQLLQHYGEPVTLENKIIAYNAGIKRVISGVVPDITKAYIKKFKALKKKYEQKELAKILMLIGTFYAVKK